jgi:hypothetical protein
MKKLVLAATLTLSAGAFALVWTAPPVLAASHSGGSSGHGSGHNSGQGAGHHRTTPDAPGLPFSNDGGTTGDGSPCPANMSTCTGA